MSEWLLWLIFSRISGISWKASKSRVWSVKKIRYPGGYIWKDSILDYIAHSVVTFLEHFQLKYVLIIVGWKKEGLIISIFDIQDIHKNTVRVDFMLDIFPKLSHVNMIFILTVIQFLACKKMSNYSPKSTKPYSE